MLTMNRAWRCGIFEKRLRGIKFEINNEKLMIRT